MESQPQNSEFRINLENFHLCKCVIWQTVKMQMKCRISSGSKLFANILFGNYIL